MARSSLTIDELRAVSRDLNAAADVIRRAADELSQAGLASVLAHSSMMTSTYLPAVAAFASDVLASAIQTSMAAQAGVTPKVELDRQRAERQKAAANRKKKANK